MKHVKSIGTVKEKFVRFTNKSRDGIVFNCFFFNLSHINPNEISCFMILTYHLNELFHKR